jgi:hypothetical protein
MFERGFGVNMPFFSRPASNYTNFIDDTNETSFNSNGMNNPVMEDFLRHVSF